MRGTKFGCSISHHGAIMNESRILHCVAITTTPEAADAVAELLERRLGEVPASYSMEGQWMAVVSAYSKAPSAKLRAFQASLRAGLRRIAACGLDIAPGTIAVRRVRPQDWAESWKRHFKPL